MFGWLNPWNWFQEAETDDLSSELSAAKIALQAAQQTINDLVVRIDELEAENDSLQESITTLSSSNAALQVEVDFLREETPTIQDYQSDPYVEAALNGDFVQVEVDPVVEAALRGETIDNPTSDGMGFTDWVDGITLW
jgi:FtsZ-binding cell division protein ZapB